MTPCIEVTTIVAGRDAARRLGTRAVEARLAACAQVIGPVLSVYRWQGEVQEAEEWRCSLKTVGAAWPALAAFLRSEHSYELPEIVVAPLDGTTEYLSWVESCVSVPHSPATA